MLFSGSPESLAPTRSRMISVPASAKSYMGWCACPLALLAVAPPVKGGGKLLEDYQNRLVHAGAAGHNALCRRAGAAWPACGSESERLLRGHALYCGNRHRCGPALHE